MFVKKRGREVIKIANQEFTIDKFLPNAILLFNHVLLTPVRLSSIFNETGQNVDSDVFFLPQKATCDSPCDSISSAFADYSSPNLVPRTFPYMGTRLLEPGSGYAQKPCAERFSALNSEPFLERNR